MLPDTTTVGPAPDSATSAREAAASAGDPGTASGPRTPAVESVREDGRLRGNAGRHPHVGEFGITMTTTPNPVKLSAHEVAILRLLGDGLTQHSAARRLDISGRTLRRHMRAICGRLQVCEPIEAVVWAARQGLL